MITSPASYTRHTGTTNETLITSTRCALIAIIPEAATAGTVTTRDAQATGTSNVSSISAAALPQAGKIFGPFGIQQGGLTVQLSSAGDVVTVVWMPLP